MILADNRAVRNPLQRKFEVEGAGPVVSVFSGDRSSSGPGRGAPLSSEQGRTLAHQSGQLSLSLAVPHLHNAPRRALDGMDVIERPGPGVRPLHRALEFFLRNMLACER